MASNVLVTNYKRLNNKVITNVDIILSKDITIKDVRVCSTKIGNQGLEMNIGMDIIML